MNCGCTLFERCETAHELREELKKARREYMISPPNGELWKNYQAKHAAYNAHFAPIGQENSTGAINTSATF